MERKEQIEGGFKTYGRGTLASNRLLIVGQGAKGAGNRGWLPERNACTMWVSSPGVTMAMRRLDLLGLIWKRRSISFGG